MSVSYKPLSDRKTREFINFLHRNNLASGSGRGVKILHRSLDFAPGWSVYELEDYGETPFRKQTFLSDDKTVLPVTYGNDPGGFINSVFTRVIKQDNVWHYLVFYCQCWLVNGERLLPITCLDELSLHDDLAPITRKSLEQDFQGFPLIETNGPDYVVTAICLFTQALFRIVFTIGRDGSVRIESRDLLVDDLPVKNFS